MADTVVSPNMNLPVPIVGQDAGPQYATDVNSCLNVIDGHNHSSGSGVQITPNGLLINTDLPFNQNNLTLVNSVRFGPLAMPLPASSPDLGCLYESGVDLYFNDGAGNQIRITQSGGIAGSPGSIANLTSPASASYVSGTATFVWQSDANTAANMDAGSYILRNITDNSKGLTLNPPSAMASDYSLILPNIPAQTSVLGIDNTGNISSVVSSVDPVGANAIANSRTRTVSTTVGAGGVAISLGSGTASSSSATLTDVNNLTVTITTTGRPVYFGLIPDPANNFALTGIRGTSGGYLVAVRGTTQIGYFVNATSTGTPAGSVNLVDPVGAGTYTYKLQYANFNSTAVIVDGCKLVVYEL